MSLIKMAFWLSIIIVLAPIDTSPPENAEPAEPRLSAGLSDQAAGIARATVSDMASFCDRNPEACQTGTRLMDRFGAKAISLAGYVFDVVSGSRETRGSYQEPRPRAQKVVAPPATPQTSPASPRTQNTLQPSDLEAPWVGPVDTDA